MKTKSKTSQYLICESPIIFFLLMFSAGMMGAYTFNIRGGVFCNAQTANFVIMSISFGKGEIMKGLYFLLPITAYTAGTVISESLPTPVKQWGFLRWDTYLIAFEVLILFLIGFVPLSVPHQFVQITVNFIAAMQYNTFRQAEGIPMATTFCTNHLRQVGVAVAKVARKKDHAALKRGLMHAAMLFFFALGGTILTFACDYLEEKSIWLALLPMGYILARLVYADLCVEQDLLEKKPSGH